MIVAGIGCRKGVETSAVVGAVEAAFRQCGRNPRDLSLLATGPVKQGEPAIKAAAAQLGVPLKVPSEAALAAAEPLLATASDLSRSVSGSSSLSEAAALAVVGQGGRLLGPRTVLGPVACALAESARDLHVSGERA